MAKKKAATAKAAVVRGNTYVLTAVGQTQLAEISGQGKQIRDAVKALKSPTSSQVVSRVGKKLGAPNPAKTVAFYLAIWHKAGYVKFGPKTKA
jgi:hypothetical protein